MIKAYLEKKIKKKEREVRSVNKTVG